MPAGPVTPRYPSSAVTAADLGVYTNDESVQLVSPASASDTVLHFNTSSNLAANMFLVTRGLNGYEIVRVISVDTGSASAAVERARDGTVAVQHSEGQSFYPTLPAQALNQMALELAAIEAVPPGTITIDVNGSIVASRTTLNLIAGTNTTITGVDNPGQSRIDVTVASTGSSGGAPTNATYITQTPAGGLPNSQALSALATGLLKSTTATGIISTAIAATDYVSPSVATMFTAIQNFGNGNLRAINILNGAATLTLPPTTDTLVGRATVDMLTNKTISNPEIDGVVSTTGLTMPTFGMGGNKITNLGQATATTDAVAGARSIGTTTGLSGGGDLTANRTLIVDQSFAFSFSNTITFTNATAPIVSSKIGPNGTQQHTVPAVASDTIALLAATQTLANKTIAGGSNTISGLLHGTQVDNPSSGVHGVTGSIVGTTDVQTLTGKTIDDSTNAVRATKLATTGSPVIISTAAPGTAGQVLTLISATAATWQNVGTPTNTVQIQDHGSGLGGASTINFTGGGVTTTFSSGTATVTVAGGGSALTVKQSNGTPTVSSVGTINFNQAQGLSVTDNTGGIVTIGISTSPANSATLVGTGRLVSTGAGLSGGGDLSADRTLIVDQSFSPTWTGTHSFQDTKFFIVDATDATKRLAFDVTNTTAVTGTIVAAFTSAQSVTLPNATTTLVGRDTADTLSNKTIQSPAINGTVTTTGLTMPTFNMASAKITLLGQATAAGDAVAGGRLISTGAGLTGGGDLTADRTHSIDFTGNYTWTGQNSFTNATAPIIAAKIGPSSTQQHTLPVVASDTVALIAATQTLTNKTMGSSTTWSSAPTVSIGSDATGDIYYRSSGGLLTRLAIGTTGQVLNVSGGLPAWTTVSSGGGLTANTVTTNTSMSKSNVYYSNGTTALTHSLPPSSGLSVGDRVQVRVINTGSVQVNPDSAQVIIFGNFTSLSGTGGGYVITDSVKGNVIDFEYAASNTWVVSNAVGSWSVNT